MQELQNQSDIELSVPEFLIGYGHGEVRGAIQSLKSGRSPSGDAFHNDIPCPTFAEYHGPYISNSICREMLKSVGNTGGKRIAVIHMPEMLAEMHVDGVIGKIGEPTTWEEYRIELSNVFKVADHVRLFTLKKCRSMKKLAQYANCVHSTLPLKRNMPSFDIVIGRIPHSNQVFIESVFGLLSPNGILALEYEGNNEAIEGLEYFSHDGTKWFVDWRNRIN